MLIIENQEYFDKVKADASATEGAAKAFQDALDMLHHYGDLHGDGSGLCNVALYADWSPNSFVLSFRWRSGSPWSGALIYSGPGLNGSGDARSDGGAPSFTVSLDPDAASGQTHKWSVHT